MRWLSPGEVQIIEHLTVLIRNQSNHHLQQLPRQEMHILLNLAAHSSLDSTNQVLTAHCLPELQKVNIYDEPHPL